MMFNRPLLFLSAFAAVLAPAYSADDPRVETLLARMSLEQKVDLIGGVDGFYVRGYPEMGLPRLRMADGPMGVRNFGFATAFPAGIALAATWDPEMAGSIGRGIGRDARAKGVHFLLGPGVNIYRSPLNGRNFEYFGEDPFLGSRIAVAYIQGIQSQGVVATVKHFVGNESEFDRHNLNAIIDERTAREIYLPIFEAAVKEGKVGAIMDAYNLVNGQHMTQNGPLNTDLAKKEWGFRGIVMSDWVATYDGVAAANGGLDLEMPSGKFMNRASLLPALRAGTVSMATIDDKVRRILRIGTEFGFLDRDQTDLSIPRSSEENREIALRGAEESMVLLKNEQGTLPLDKSAVKTVAIFGPNAYPAVPVGGGSAGVEPFVAVSYLEGLSHYLGGSTRVLYNPGIVPTEEIQSQTAFTVDEGGTKAGLRGEYFGNVHFTGTPRVRTDAHIDFEWRGTALPPAPSAIRWTGYFKAAKSGAYDWFVTVDSRDECRLFLDGKLVFHYPTAEHQMRTSIEVPMEAGRTYAVRFECMMGVPRRAGLGAIFAADLVTPAAAAIAAKADAAVVCVGFNPSIETEGADRTFTLPAGQDALVQAVAAANPKTIVVLNAGGSADVAPWIGRVPALIQAWYSGQESGRALPKLLFGEVNPSGHLPVSFERRLEDNPTNDSYHSNAPENSVAYREGIFVGYRGYDRSGIAPLFPFGLGLSYTRFAWRDAKIERASSDSAAEVEVSFEVANTGEREGAAVAQLYVGNPTARLPRPAKELKGIARVTLRPGESKRVTIPLARSAFSYWDTVTHAWKADPGQYVVFVGPSSADLPIRLDLVRP